MFDVSTLFLFMGTSLILIIIPGPDLIFTLMQGITNGRKAGVVTALGLSVGNTLHTFAAAIGLSMIVKTSVIAFTIFKLLGATYLLFLAYKSIKFRKGKIDVEGTQNSDSKGLFLKGVLMNILNPKVAIFFLTFLPQFVNYRINNVPLQMCILGLIFIILTGIVFSIIGYFSGSIRNLLLRSPHANEVMNIVAGVIFIALAITLVVTKL